MPYQETKESSSAAVRFALASSRPVLVTDNHIFDEFSSSVYRIPQCSPEEIAKGVLDLYKDEALQRRIVDGAKAMIEEMCWTNVSEKYEGLIWEICPPISD
jgi:lipid A disaccharide synthetase